MRAALCWLVGSLLALHVVQAHRYARVWSSDVTLWACAAQAAPLKPRPWINYGSFLLEARRLDEAEAVLQYADRLLQQPRVDDHERTLSRGIIEQNMMLLSYLTQVEARGGP